MHEHHDPSAPHPSESRTSSWEDLSSALPDGFPREPASYDIVWNWSLALTARGVPHQAQRTGWGWKIFVPEDYLSTAANEIANFEQENREQDLADLALANPASDQTGLTTALVMGTAALFFTLTHADMPVFGYRPVDWNSLGAANAGAILDGQWWRLITALTLHADAAHFLSNAAIGGILMAFLCRELRSGPGWVLFLLAGTLGNLANAVVKGFPHTSIGASTGVFGVVGILGALRAVRDKRLNFRRTFAPVAAGLALLAFMGTGGERTDLGAHVFGFLAGLALGASAGFWVNARGIPSETANRILGLMALALPVLAWMAAFSYS